MAGEGIIAKNGMRLTKVIELSSVQKMWILKTDIDKLLSNQPYLVQTLEETSHALYWDITEEDLG